MSLAIAAEPIPLRTDSDGVIRVSDTRVTLDTVVFAFLHGATAEGIAESYPSLDLADIYAVIAYYLRHREEVDAYLREREISAEAIREKIERQCPPHGILACLLARRGRQEQ